MVVIGMRNEEKFRWSDGNNGDSRLVRGKMDDFRETGNWVLIKTKHKHSTLVGVRPARPGRPGPPRPVTRTDADGLFFLETDTSTPT